ncbi:redoxin domain-containing protein [Paenibacillus turpanensis]|uniref:redoxin domain-containing protein n=1 Tax=Paenibacillus turpanensis TaxID=2689078 RepID=UPI0031330978
MSNRKLLQIVILLAVVAIGVYTIGGSLFMSDKQEPPKAKEPMPNFTLTDASGKQVSLEDFKGKPVIVNFWGTFCPPCVEETPALQRQYEKWKQEGLVIIGVNLDEEPIRVESFTRQFGVTYPVVIDKDLELAERFGVFQYPTTFFVNRDGVIQDIFVGGMQEPYIENMVGAIR